ncbi:hypothetical protein NE237_023855 [Protea cynaroides]|uniref:Uncharacterized protein n=1 Tax=Protea cynaroides TaxID=273540 RepID=A0A9Q0K5K4_9MAGN|nr:hypothetical protein NE237_023855 [Protea cynaroides]
MVGALVGVLVGHWVRRQRAMVEKLIWLIGCINETWWGYHSWWLSLRGDSLMNLKAVFPMARGITMIGINLVLGILERLLSGVVEFNRAAMSTVTAVASSSGNDDPGLRRILLVSWYFFSTKGLSSLWYFFSSVFLQDLLGEFKSGSSRRFFLRGVFFSTAWRLNKFFSRFKMSVCKVVYHFENRSQPKVLDSDLYSYIDVIYDIYNSVLRHIPEEKSISFKVKCVMEDIDVEMEIDSDGKVQQMFQVNQQGSEFHLHVYDVNVFDEYPNVINGYSKTIMDRKGRVNMMGVNVDQNVGKRRIQKTLARRFVSEPRDKEATHVHEVQVVPISEPRVVEAVETVEESCGNQSSTDDAEWSDSGEED